MDIEQLKLILETMGSAGQGAFWFGLLWLSKGIVITGLWIGVIIYTLRIKIAPFFVNLGLLESIKDLMGFRGDLVHSESEEILNSLKFAADVKTVAGLHYTMSAEQREKILDVVRKAFRNE